MRSARAAGDDAGDGVLPLPGYRARLKQVTENKLGAAGAGQFLELLRQSRRPMLYAGGGSINGEASVERAVVVLLAISKDQSRLDATIEIARPPDVVFAWVTEPARVKQWLGWLVEIRPVISGGAQP